MIILQIKSVNFIGFNLKDYAPVAGERYAPLALSIAMQLVKSPSRQRRYVLNILCGQKGGNDIPDFLYLRRRQSAGIVVLDKSSEPLMANALEVDNSLYGNTVRLSSVIFLIAPFVKSGLLCIKLWV